MFAVIQNIQPQVGYNDQCLQRHQTSPSSAEKQENLSRSETQQPEATQRRRVRVRTQETREDLKRAQITLLEINTTRNEVKKKKKLIQGAPVRVAQWVYASNFGSGLDLTL